MSGPLRILHTADSHIGADLPARPRLERPRRGDDLVASYRRTLAAARAHDVDLVIHAGDLFDLPRPSSRALVAAAEPLLELAASGIPVVVAPGNHERSAIPANLLLAHPHIHILSTPRTLSFDLRGVRVCVAGFPCLRRGASRGFAAALAATGWAGVAADVKILAVHQTFESATCGPGDFRFRGGGDVVECGAVPAGFSYVAAGHIHRHQVLTHPDAAGLPIVYSGSPDRVSFAELNEPKGFVLLEDDGGGLQHRFVEHAVRPMSAWPLDVTGLTREALADRIEHVLRGLPRHAVAQIRLSGCTTRDRLRGLRVSGLAGEIRPDALVTVTMQAVEFVSWRDAELRGRPIASAFEQVDAPPATTICKRVDEVSGLPAGRGVYALYDSGGRLLYVGKAANTRARVRTHLRGKSGANFFRGWGRQIAEIETRSAHSDLEALLIEAELIRKLRPPFNRQMRRWTGYRYLGTNGQPFGQLFVRREVDTEQSCFGPYRGRRLAEDVRAAVAAQFGLALCPDDLRPSKPFPLLPDGGPTNLCRRYHDGLCSGPCAGRASTSEYAQLIRRRDALLAGADDASLRELEEYVSRVETGPTPHGTVPDLTRRAQLLRVAFDHAATLRVAERLLHGVIVMPGPEGRRKLAMLALRGVRFETLSDDTEDAARVLARYGKLLVGVDRRRPARLPAHVVDGFCTAARQLRAAPGRYRFLSAAVLARLDEAGLKSLAFGSQDAERQPRCAASARNDRADAAMLTALAATHR